ncbi:YceD family protein [Mucilaginibacter glaciei]|uniref:DUF177 domain-containing protein n=1 Tax=Mucilaginibacter glaciei TaxID=2772109 RepID=A0A926S2Z8_9SPHI|nr:DUF177 domain-containing protein [Mucilaginibacter glaciei]MBD1393684.1 DUF177 domain-containing protein [Mucilaginibacter glaciei]
MKSLRTYAIPFTGLKLGKHTFEYDVTDEFFNEFDYSLVKKADLKCVIELEKQETMLILDFDITGTITATCDKCLSEYQQPIDIQEQQIARFTDEEMGEDDEIITLGKNDHEINVAGLIYEYVNVALPFIAECSNEGNGKQCEEEMLDNLRKLSVNDEQAEQADPRWDALKKLK